MDPRAQARTASSASYSIYTGTHTQELDPT